MTDTTSEQVNTASQPPIESTGSDILQGIPQPPPLQMTEDMIGAIKIKDALFIGDELAAQDLEFVVNNKVTHIINCSGRQIANHWEPIGVAYLTFYWLDVDNQVLFDKNDKITSEILNFIEEAHTKGESVLVHSNRGQSRASAVLVVYFMQKYKWTLFKTLEFLNSRRPDLEIRAAFINQLSEFERRLCSQGRGPESGDWNELSNKINIDEDNLIENEELLLRNTFLNAQMGPIALYKFDELEQKHNQNRLQWIDNNCNPKELRTNISEDDLIFKDQPEPVITHREGHSVKPIIKSIIQNEGNNPVQLNFYQPEDDLLYMNESLEPELQAHQTEDNVKSNTIAGHATYDPMMGNKEFGNTMPLPQKNNLLESNRVKTDNDLACKKFLEKIKEGDGPNKKHVKRNKKAYNYILENKKKIRKDSAKRKRSAKGRDTDKRLNKEINSQKQVIHRKSYSEVVRDQKKKSDRPGSKTKVDKDVVINWKNVYNFNIQNSQLVNSKNASIQYFSKNNANQKANSTSQKISKKNKEEMIEKGLKKFSQGYTVNKLAKEGLLNRKCLSIFAT